MTLNEQILSARGRLVTAGFREAPAQRDAELLARTVLGWDMARLISCRHEPEPDGFAQPYFEAVNRRLLHEPVAYIMGRREFWGLDFEVSPDVLIPRPESELIVEEALTRLPPATPGTPLALSLADAGTGSGCLGVALATELPGARVVATDISLEALIVAQRNVAAHGLSTRIRLVQTDLLAGVHGPFDLIVSNPPYIPAASAPALPPEVGKHEPSVALYAGEDGLVMIRKLLAQAATRLALGGWLLFEFGYGQDGEVETLIAQAPTLTLAEIREDLQGIPRVAVVRRSA